MMYPLVGELAVDGIPVAVTCRVLTLARQPYYRWLACPVGARELDQAYLANAVFDAHADDPEFGYRLLADEARAAGQAGCDRTVWRICAANRWWSCFGTKRGRNGKKPGAAVHDDLVERNFTAPAPNTALAHRHHRAPHRRRQAVPVRGEGRLLRPDRGLLDR